jgi:hypothetical protein
MRQSFPRTLLLLTVVALGAGACDSDEMPTSPTPAPTVTDTFTGTLNPNGAVTHQFNVTAATGGTITATLKSVDPTDKAIGFSLGNWNGVFCQAVLANDAALQTATLSGTTQTPASLCVRVYDVGTLGETAVAYTVEVVHP